MDDTGEIEFIFLFDRDNVTVATHSYQRVLKILLVIGVVQNLFQLLAHTVFRDLDTGTQTTQFIGSAVFDLAFFRNGVFQLLFQTRQRLQAFSISGQRRCQLVLFLQKGFDLANSGSRAADLHQAACFQHRT